VNAPSLRRAAAPGAAGRAEAARARRGRRFGLRTLDLASLPPRIAADAGEDGLGLVLRAEGRFVGFRLLARAELGDGIDPARLYDDEVRAALRVERLRAVASAAQAPQITVAICTKDRPDWVARLLASLEPLCRADPDVEVLVIDNASATDALEQVCAGRPWARRVPEPRVGLDFARNRALAEARGEVVAYLDDDVAVDRGWLAGLRRAWSENPDAGCVTGNVLPMALDTEAQVLFELRGGFRRGFRPFRYGPERYDAIHYPRIAGHFGVGANMSFRRDLVRALGGFDEALDTGRPLPGGGDIDMFYRVLRAGAMLVYEPQAVVLHEHRRDRAALARQYYSWGLAFMAFVEKSARAEPAARAAFRSLAAFWFGFQARRLAARLVGREPTPLPLIVREIWGGLVGASGEYRRSERRVAAIRAAA
jgi:GT2 family glycosyltransferase